MCEGDVVGGGERLAVGRDVAAWLPMSRYHLTSYLDSGYRRGNCIEGRASVPPKGQA